MIACLSNSHQLRDKYNTIRPRRELQAWNEKDSMPSELLVLDPQGYIKSLRLTKKALVQKLAELYHKYHTVYIRQDTLARWLRVSRKTINLLLGQLIEDGVIVSYYRHKKSNYYKFSNYMMEKSVLSSISSTMSIFSNFLHENVTQCIDYLFIKKEKTELPHTRCVQRNSFLTSVQEKVARFIKGSQIIRGLADQTEFYESLGYERLE